MIWFTIIALIVCGWVGCCLLAATYLNPSNHAESDAAKKARWAEEVKRIAEKRS